MRKTIIAVAAAALSGGLLAGAANAAAPFTVKLLAFNDYHGNLNVPGGTTRAPGATPSDPTVLVPTGGVAYLQTLINQRRALNPANVTVAAGDLVGASPLVSALFHEESSIETLNQLGVEFSSVGNHEFDKGRKELRRLQNGGCFPGGTIGVDTCIVNGQFSGAKFKYLAANVVVDATGGTLFAPYKIKLVKGAGAGQKVPVAFIGAVLRATPTIVTPTGVAGLSFTDEAAAINQQVASLKAQGVHSFVVLIHQGGVTTGLFNDASCPSLTGEILPIVNALDPDVDVVVSGHTHQAYLCHGTASDGVKQILLTSAGAFGRILTDIDLTVDPTTRDIISASAQNLLVVNDSLPNPLPTVYPTLTRDAGQQSILNTYNALAEPLANQIIGSITADITRTAGLNGESSLGDLIADAQLEATQGPAQQAVIAFQNPGGIRADLLFAQISGGEASGQVTYGEAFTVQPFGNSLVTLTLTGAQLKTALEQQFDNPAVGQQRFLQLSNGFTYTYDFTAAAGSHVDAASMRINGVQVDPAASYRVTVNNFVAAGGDNFLIFRSATNSVGGAQDIDALSAYLGAHSPVAPTAANRIVRVH